MATKVEFGPIYGHRGQRASAWRGICKNLRHTLQKSPFASPRIMLFLIYAIVRNRDSPRRIRNVLFYPDLGEASMDSRKLMKSLMATALCAVAATANAQQPFPSKPIRFLVPYAPGGTTTIMARLVGERFTSAWGQQVLVDNRPGGNTIIASEAMVKAPADGYTILLVASTHTINATLLPTPYDAIKDFAPVATLVSTEFMLVAHPSVPANNLQEFIALAKKAKPGQFNYASAGAGGAPHLAGELFKMLTGSVMEHIPYKGTVPALTDVVGGQAQLIFNDPPAVIPFIKGGRVKALAITGASRMAAVPDVPTFSEAGLKGFEIRNWYGVLAPAATPKDVIAKLSTEINRYLSLPETKEKLGSMGLDPFISTPDQFANLIKGDIAKFGKIIKSANIKIEL